MAKNSTDSGLGRKDGGMNTKKIISDYMAALGHKGGKKGGAVKSARKKRAGRLNAAKAREALAEKRAKK